MSNQGVNRVGNLIWDETNKKWVPMPFAEIPPSMGARWEYNADGTVLYAGYAPRGVAEGADGWLLQKFTYTNSQPTKREIAYHNWTARASGVYA